MFLCQGLLRIQSFPESAKIFHYIKIFFKISHLSYTRSVFVVFFTYDFFLAGTFAVRRSLYTELRRQLVDAAVAVYVGGHDTERAARIRTSAARRFHVHVLRRRGHLHLWLMLLMLLLTC